MQDLIDNDNDDSVTAINIFINILIRAVLTIQRVTAEDKTWKQRINFIVLVAYAKCRRYFGIRLDPERSFLKECKAI
jgi:hypothetical protein